MVLPPRSQKTAFWMRRHRTEMATNKAPTSTLPTNPVRNQPYNTTHRYTRSTTRTLTMRSWYDTNRMPKHECNTSTMPVQCWGDVGTIQYTITSKVPMQYQHTSSTVNSKNNTRAMPRLYKLDADIRSILTQAPATKQTSPRCTHRTARPPAGRSGR